MIPTREEIAARVAATGDMDARYAEMLICVGMAAAHLTDPVIRESIRRSMRDGSFFVFYLAELRDVLDKLISESGEANRGNGETP